MACESGKFPGLCPDFSRFLAGYDLFCHGFFFVSLKDVFWRAAESVRRGALVVAFLLYLVRLVVFQLEGEPSILTAFESMSWMLACFSKAVYPVYIVHLPLQYFFSYYIILLSLPAAMKVVLLLILTFGGSLTLYAFSLKLIKWVRPLFGLKL